MKGHRHVKRVIRWLPSKFLNQCAAALTDGFVAQVSDVARSRLVFFQFERKAPRGDSTEL